MKKLAELRTEAQKAGLYAVEEKSSKWACIRRSDLCCLTRGERSESLALAAGLARVNVTTKSTVKIIQMTLLIT